MKSTLVRLFGFPATLIHGDTLVLDRWLWLRRRLKSVPPRPQRVLDVGCGTGAFTIGMARLGYRSLGLSWDERNQTTARERAALCRAPLAEFEICDVRQLDRRKDLLNQFDIVVNCENIEHILDDRKLMLDIAACMKPGGTLLLTTPYFHYKPITKDDDGPFLPVEDGRHVRRGYTEDDLRDLCAGSGLTVQEIGFISGPVSQKVTALLRTLSRLVHPMVGWIAVLPFRPLAPLLDPILTRVTGWPGFCITLVATKRS
jgi:SAM-dependent methyltransferase